ncbi:MAG: hypothetical protein ACTHJ0_00640 [Flavipsychrobacter sp.]
MKKKIWITIVILLLLLPLWMWMAWLLTPKKKLVIAIIDKTVLTTAGQEHSSLTWILNNERYTKNKHDLYSVSHDYFGFFPKDNEKYRIKGLERFSSEQIRQLSNDADAVYITDAYGIYRNEWYAKAEVSERSGMIYGGLSQQDIDLMKEMKTKHKLVMAEFNTIGSSTNGNIRQQFEQIFALHWTGWLARYFESLDTAINTEIPKWLINDYLRSGHKWTFKNAGIAFVNDQNEAVVLELGKHLSQPIPKIVTNDNLYGLPQSLYYPFWFDVTVTDTTINKVVARFVLDLTDSGKRELTQHNIPITFPAVQLHQDDQYSFAYFSGDFSDNPIKFTSSYFKGIPFFSFPFYNHFDKTDRAGFFWKYYRPLVTGILHDYYKNIKK